MNNDKIRDALYRITHSGYNRDGFNTHGWDKAGYNKDGYNLEGYNKQGYDHNGFNKESYDRFGFNKEGYDHNGFDKEGYDKEGYDRNGLNKEGYDVEGYDGNGFNKEGYEKEGYDRNGFNKEGYDCNGFNKEGYDFDGYDRDGFGMDGFNRKTRLHRNGKEYNEVGIDMDGYDKRGFSSDNIYIHKNGTPYDEQGFDYMGYDISGKDIDGIHVIDNNAEDFQLSKAYNLTTTSNLFHILCMRTVIKKEFRSSWCMETESIDSNESYHITEKHIIRRTFEDSIEVDLHGYHVAEASYFLQNLLDNIDPSIETISIIHGYHSGRELMRLVQRDIKHPKIYRKIVPENNKGRTDFELFARGSTESKDRGLDELIDCEPELLGGNDLFL
jgi:hypothetical protein